MSGRITRAASYGATFTEQLTAAGLTVAEASDVLAISRRRHGKSDTLDAIAMPQAAPSSPVAQRHAHARLPRSPEA